MRSVRPPPKVMVPAGPPAHLFEPSPPVYTNNRPDIASDSSYISRRANDVPPQPLRGIDGRLSEYASESRYSDPMTSMPRGYGRPPGDDDRGLDRGRPDFDSARAAGPGPSMAPARREFDADVEQEMRALEMNIRKMLADDPVLASAFEKGDAPSERPNPSKYHLSDAAPRLSAPPADHSRYPSTSDRYSVNDRDQYNPPSTKPPHYGAPPANHHAPAGLMKQQPSPPRRKQGLNNLYETEDNLRLRAEKQAAYSQQLQQQMRERNNGGMSNDERSVRRQQSESSRNNANFLDGFSSDRKPAARFDHTPAPVPAPVVEERRPPRRHAAPEDAGGTGLMLGHDKSEELALKRAKQQQYKQQLDSQVPTGRFPSNRRGGRADSDLEERSAPGQPIPLPVPQRQAPPPRQTADPYGNGGLRDEPHARGAPMDGRRDGYPRDSYSSRDPYGPPQDEYVVRGRQEQPRGRSLYEDVGFNDGLQPPPPRQQPQAGYQPPAVGYTPSFQQQPPQPAAKSPRDRSGLSLGTGLGIGGDVDADQRRKQQQAEHRRLLEAQMREQKAAKEAEKKLIADEEAKFLREAALLKEKESGGSERERHKKTQLQIQQEQERPHAAAKAPPAQPQHPSHQAPPEVDLTDDAAFEEMVRRQMMRERENLRAQLLEDESRRGGGYAAYAEEEDSYHRDHHRGNAPRANEPGRPPMDDYGYGYGGAGRAEPRADPRDRESYDGAYAPPPQKAPAPLTELVTPRDAPPRGYPGDYHSGGGASSPSKSPTAARLRLQSDIYGRNNPLTGETGTALPPDSTASGGDKWLPSGKVRSDRQRAAQAEQRAALDRQREEDRLRKEREDEQEKAREKALEDKIRQAAEREAQEAREKDLKRREETRRDMEAAQRKHEEEAAKRRNMRRPPPQAETPAGEKYDYAGIASPLKDALHQHDTQHQQYQAQPPPKRSTADTYGPFDDPRRLRREEQHHPPPQHGGPPPRDSLSDAVDNYRGDYPSSGGYGGQGQDQGYGHHGYGRPPPNVRDSGESHFASHQPPPQRAPPPQVRPQPSYYEPQRASYNSNYSAGGDDEYGDAYDLSLVAESRLVEPDTSGLLAELLPRRSQQNAPRQGYGHAGGLGAGRALDLEKSLASASTFLYLGEQTPVDLPGSAAQSAQRPRTNHTPVSSATAVRPVSGGASLTAVTPRDPASMPPAGRPTSTASSASSNTQNFLHHHVPQQQAPPPQVVPIPSTRVLQQPSLPSAEEVPENRRFLRPNNASNDPGQRDGSHSSLSRSQSRGRSEVDPSTNRNLPSDSLSRPLSNSSRPLDDAPSSAQPWRSSPAVGEDAARPGSSGGVQYRSKFAQELLAGQASNPPSRPLSSQAPAAEEAQGGRQTKKAGGWDLANRDQTVRQLSEHSSSVAALLSGQYAPREVERPKALPEVPDPDLLLGDEDYAFEE